MNGTKRLISLYSGMDYPISRARLIDVSYQELLEWIEWNDYTKRVEGILKEHTDITLKNIRLAVQEQVEHSEVYSGTRQVAGEELLLLL